MRLPRRFPSQSAHDMRIKYDQISNHQGLHLCETLSLSVAICCATAFNNLTLLRALGKAGTLAGSLPRFGTSSLSSVLVWSRDGPRSIACVLTDTHNTWHHNTQHVAHNNLLRLGLRKGLNRQERSSMTLTANHGCLPPSMFGYGELTKQCRMKLELMGQRSTRFTYAAVASRCQ